MQIQMARIVFFCPSDCPHAIVSLEALPMALPVKNWNRHAMREPRESRRRVCVSVGSSMSERTVIPIAMVSAIAHM